MTQTDTSNGCESVPASVIVQTSAKPDLSISTAAGDTSFFHCKGSSITLHGLVSPAALNYQWLHSGVLIPGATDDSLITADDGEYSLIVSNGPDCTDTAAVVVKQDSSFISTALSPTEVYICPGVHIKLYASPVSPGLSYEWLKDGLPLSGIASAPELETGDEGVYSVHISNTAGCSFSSNTSVVTTYPALPKPVITRIGASLFAPAGYTSYQWYRNGKAVSGAAASLLPLSFDGDYYVTISDKKRLYAVFRYPVHTCLICYRNGVC